MTIKSQKTETWIHYSDYFSKNILQKTFFKKMKKAIPSPKCHSRKLPIEDIPIEDKTGITAARTIPTHGY